MKGNLSSSVIINCQSPYVSVLYETMKVEKQSRRLNLNIILNCSHILTCCISKADSVKIIWVLLGPVIQNEGL